jgi:hypothetical protein
VDDSDEPRTIFPLRLAVSLREHVQKLAALDGVSMNQFIKLAVAEKINRLESASLGRSAPLRKAL